MSPEDPRHGTSAGYIAGCRSECCWRAKQRYDKRRRWEATQGFARKVPVIGTLRRIQALRAVGWSVPKIAAHAGLAWQQVYDIGRHPTVYLSTYRAIAATFEALADEEPPREARGDRHAATKSARTAARNGWPPPSAWLDIDDPDEQPDPGWRPTRYAAAELAAEWDHLRRAGVSIHTAAQQLGVSVGAIEKAIERSRKETAA